MLGGMYALIAIGFNLQYGIARVLNLAYGEFLVTAAFAAYLDVHAVADRSDPRHGSVGAGHVRRQLAGLSRLMEPLVRRARNRDHLEGDTILSTFGLLFVHQGQRASSPSPATSALRLSHHAGEDPRRQFCRQPRARLRDLLRVRGRRSISILTRTRTGTAMRALAIDPVAASMVGVDVRRCRRSPLRPAARWWRSRARW